VQMTRKRIGQGLLETCSTPCETCHGRGVKVQSEPIGYAADSRPRPRRQKVTGPIPGAPVQPRAEAEAETETAAEVELETETEPEAEALAEHAAEREDDVEHEEPTAEVQAEPRAEDHTEAQPAAGTAEPQPEAAATDDQARDTTEPGSGVN